MYLVSGTRFKWSPFDSRDCIHDLFEEEVQSLDFHSQPELSATVVNNWIDQATNGQIKDILGPDLSSETKAVLANAAYFKGSWASQFDPDYTEEEIFYTPNNQTFVPMMNKKGNFNHGKKMVNCEGFPLSQSPRRHQ